MLRGSLRLALYLEASDLLGIIEGRAVLPGEDTLLFNVVQANVRVTLNQTCRRETHLGECRCRLWSQGKLMHSTRQGSKDQGYWEGIKCYQNVLLRYR